MITPRESPSREVLERIATDLRRQGYEVAIEPRGGDLPAFLAGATPDLIARRPGESIVVEVKSSPELADHAQATEWARKISAEPGWRFVIVAPPPAKNASELTSLDERAVRRLLEESRTLARSEHTEAALLTAWAATEAVMRLLLKQHGLRAERDDPGTLIRSLASEGYLTDDAFALLNDAGRLRSLVAHGRGLVREDSASAMRNATQALTRLSQDLLNELQAA